MRPLTSELATSYRVVSVDLLGHGHSDAPDDPARYHAACLQRDWTQAHSHNASVQAAWKTIYSRPQAHWALYQLGEKLTDIEEAFRLWRFRHLTTVQRVIGFKPGTGGTNGVGYLQKMLDVVLFPELWAVRTELS